MAASGIVPTNVLSFAQHFYILILKVSLLPI